MVGFILVELAALALMWGVFIAGHLAAPGGRHGMVWWQLLLMAVTGFGEAVSLFLLGAGHMLPLWVYAVGWGAMDVTMAGWLVLQWRARRREKAGQ